MKKVKLIINKYGPKLIGTGLNLISLVSPRRAALKSLDIFCTPRAGKIKSYQKKFLKKFDQKALSFKNFQIMTYHYQGGGPTILLCHGWESNTFRWRKLFKHLREANFNIISIDAPAHGASGSDRFTALLYAEMINEVVKEFKPTIICGHSVGGMASIFNLHEFRETSINQAIILASPDKLEDLTDNYFSIIGGSLRLRKAYNRLMPELFGHPISYFSAADMAGKLMQRCLIIHDRGDRINKIEEGQRIHEKWNDSKLITTEGLGHSLQDEKVFKAILDELLVSLTLTRV